MGRKVTIGIPVFNVEKYIRNSLISALNQTYANIDYLIVDDRGQDNSMSIVRELMTKHPRGGAIRIIEHERNLGIAAVRNTIIDHAHGCFLFFLDSDDVISSDCIASHVYYIEKYQCDFTCSSSEYVFQNGKKTAFRKYEKIEIIKGEVFCVAKRAYSLDKPMHIPVWNRLYRKDFLVSNGIRCVPGLVHEDIWFTWQLLLSADSCVFIPEVTYWYYERPSSFTSMSNHDSIIKNNHDKGKLLEMMASSVKTNFEMPKSIKQLLAIRIMRKAISYSNSVIKEVLLNSLEKRELTHQYVSSAQCLYAYWTMDLNRNIEMLKCMIRLMQYRCLKK